MRVKVKANAMEDANVKFISLVTRPASRIPFRITKSENSEQENGLMISLSNMFKRDGDAPKKVSGPILAAVVLQKAHEEFITPKLKELGLKMDDRIENDDVVILRQCEYADDAVVALKLGEFGGLFLNLPDEVQKGFDPFVQSSNFDENLAKNFVPGMHVATEALFDTVMSVLRSADTAGEAASDISTTLDQYKVAVVGLANALPELAFKIDALTLDGFEASKDDADVEAKETEESDAAKEVSAKADADDSAEADADSAGSEDDSGAAEAAAKSEAGAGEGDDAESAGESEPTHVELSDAEKLALKGVHIDGGLAALTTNTPAKATEAKPAVKAEKPKADDKENEQSEPDLAAVVKAALAPVLEAVSGVRSEVAELKTKQDELASKVDATAEESAKAIKAVKSTVPSNSDAGDTIPNESLGTRSRAKADGDGMWGGTSLDRIVKDFG